MVNTRFFETSPLGNLALNIVGKLGKADQHHEKRKIELDDFSLNTVPLAVELAGPLQINLNEKLERVVAAVTRETRIIFDAFDAKWRMAAYNQARDVASGELSVEHIMATQGVIADLSSPDDEAETVGERKIRLNLYVRLVLQLAFMLVLAACTAEASPAQPKPAETAQNTKPPTPLETAANKTPAPKPTETPEPKATATATPVTKNADGSPVSESAQKLVNSLRTRGSELGIFMKQPTATTDEKGNVVPPPPDPVGALYDAKNGTVAFTVTKNTNIRVNAPGQPPIERGTIFVFRTDKPASSITKADVLTGSPSGSYHDLTNNLPDNLKPDYVSLELTFINDQLKLTAIDKNNVAKVLGVANKATGYQWRPSFIVSGWKFNPDLAKKYWERADISGTTSPTVIPKTPATRSLFGTPEPMKTPTQLTKATATKAAATKESPASTEHVTAPDKVYASFEELEKDTVTIFNKYGFTFKVSNKWEKYGPVPFFKPKGEEGEKAVENFAKVLEEDSRGKSILVVDTKTGERTWLPLAANAKKELVLLSEAKSLPNLPIAGNEFKYLLYMGSTGEETQANITYLFDNKDVLNGKLTKIYIVVNDPIKSPTRNTDDHGWIGADGFKGYLASLVADEKLFRDMEKTVYIDGIQPLGGNDYIDFSLKNFDRLFKASYFLSSDGQYGQIVDIY